MGKKCVRCGCGAAFYLADGGRFFCRACAKAALIADGATAEVAEQFLQLHDKALTGEYHWVKLQHPLC